jgi:uncharacterized protein
VSPVKNIFIVLRLILVLYVLLLFVVYGGQRFIVFQPVPMSKSTTFSFDVPFEEGFLETAPGIHVNYLHFKTTMPSKGLVLYFHGNADNLARWGEMHLDFTSRGYEVVMPDYRGYGKSNGKVSEVLTYQDMQQLHQHLMQTIQPAELIIYGRSLGSGIASNLARTVPAKLLLLETPFYSIPSVMEDQLLLIWLPFAFRYEFPNYANIPEVKCPIRIFHGTADRVVPYRNAERLKPLLKEKDRFITIEKGTHLNLNTFAEYQEELDSLLGEKL